MPHVIVKAWPGNTEQQKHELADRIVRDVMDVLGCGPDSVSVAVEEVPAGAWAEKVYRTDIQHPRGKLYKAPGYSM